MPWRLVRLLWIHSEAEHVRKQRRMPRGLIVTTHHAERHNGFAILHHHAGYDSMHRPFARLNPVRVIGVNAETQSPIVQDHAAVGRHDTAAETLEDRINEGNRITVTVNDA